MKSGIALLLCLLASAFASSPEENLGLDEDVYEGDMLLTKEQKAFVDGQIRASIKTRKWTGGVLVYSIDSSLANQPRALEAIRLAIDEWEQMTCIRFKKRTRERNYVKMYKGPGCTSYVGMYGGEQRLSLDSGCWRKGTVLHEIGHALGFYHEQSRPDRDNYVTIKYENIIDKYEYAFRKYSTSTIDSLGTTYDYGSIMHYGAKYFSKNGLPTIVSKPPGISFGQRTGLSRTDAKQMNLRYNCPA